MATTRSKFFPWSKGRQSITPEPYHRTGGLLPIHDSDKAIEVLLENDIESTDDAPGRRRPPNLTIVPPDYNSNDRAFFTPQSAQQYAALSKSASNLLAVVDDMLRSPAPAATLCSPPSATSAPLHKPLPGRPRSQSLPSSPEPVELPGSILLENQGFPSPPPAAGSTWNTMRASRIGNPIGPSTTARTVPSHVPQFPRSVTDPCMQRRSKSRPSLITSPSTDSKLTTCSVSTTNGDQSSSASSSRARVGVDRSSSDGTSRRKPSVSSTIHEVDHDASAPVTPTSTRSNRVDELKATITAQDQTISTLQAQFASLRSSHEAHVASLVDSHTAEVSSLRNYTKALEDQSSQHTLHHASSNHLLFVLDTSDQPLSPGRETPQTTAGAASATSASSIRSFKSALEQPTHLSPVRSRDTTPEMENLKRKLSAARRPEVNNGDLTRELNTYKTNCGALQRQVDLLMTKLNQAKTAEREKQQKLDDIQSKCDDYQKKGNGIEPVEKSTAALQNTIDHLEYRLEMANVEKVDMEEQLFSLRRMRSIFDPKQPPALPLPSDSHQSMSTVFANESPMTDGDPTNLDALLDRIEELQHQIRQKDARSATTDVELDRLRRDNEQLEDETQDLRLQLEVQSQQIAKAKQNEVHMHELRTAIMQRESLIGEKNDALASLKTQLTHHRQLLSAEVKRQAMFKLYGDVNDGLPDVSTLTSKYDIDRWVDGLKQRFQKQRAEMTGSRHPDDPESIIQELQNEINFYVSEIIYFKLDCKGYKSDIKKMKKAAAALLDRQSSGPSEADSPDLSMLKSPDLPVHEKFSSKVSGLGISTTPSPVSTGPILIDASVDRPRTPEPAQASSTRSSTKRVPKKLDLGLATIPQTPTRRKGVNTANEADNVDPGISPRSVARLSPERRKPTPPSPDQEKFGELATNFPLSTPASPTRHTASRRASDTDGPQTGTPKRSLSGRDRAKGEEMGLGRSNSGSNSKGKMTPERPPRPRVGLFESSTDDSQNTSGPRSPPRMDVMAEAMRNSPDHPHQAPQRKLSNSSAKNIPPSPTPNKPVRSSPSTANSILPQTLLFRARESPTLPSTGAKPLSPPNRAPSSSASSPSMPFVIGMGSPHNPALVAPTASVQPASCAITRNTAIKVTSPVSRTGVGGTMASTSPPAITSPTDNNNKTRISPRLINTAQAFQPHSTTTTSSTTAKPSPVSPTRTTTKSKPKPEPLQQTQTPHSTPLPTSTFAAPTTSSRSKSNASTPSHSRNVSGSSIRTAIVSTLPTRMDFMKGKGKARKESIGSIGAPTPMVLAASPPFDEGEREREQQDERGGTSFFMDD